MPARTKYTRVRIRAIIAAIQSGATYEHAAHAAGITYDTLNEWRKAKPAFSEALKAAEARGVLACLARIEQAAESGQWQAAAWVLERRYPAEYGRRDKVNVQHSGSVDVQAYVTARTAILAALAAYPEARLAVADALEALDSADNGEADHANGRG